MSKAAAAGVAALSLIGIGSQILGRGLSAVPIAQVETLPQAAGWEAFLENARILYGQAEMEKFIRSGNAYAVPRRLIFAVPENAAPPNAETLEAYAAHIGAAFGLEGADYEVMGSGGLARRASREFRDAFVVLLPGDHGMLRAERPERVTFASLQALGLADAPSVLHQVTVVYPRSVAFVGLTLLPPEETRGLFSLFSVSSGSEVHFYGNYIGRASRSGALLQWEMISGGMVVANRFEDAGEYSHAPVDFLRVLNAHGLEAHGNHMLKDGQDISQATGLVMVACDSRNYVLRPLPPSRIRRGEEAGLPDSCRGLW